MFCILFCACIKIGCKIYAPYPSHYVARRHSSCNQTNASVNFIEHLRLIAFTYRMNCKQLTVPCLLLKLTINYCCIIGCNKSTSHVSRFLQIGILKDLMKHNQNALNSLIYAITYLTLLLPFVHFHPADIVRYWKRQEAAEMVRSKKRDPMLLGRPDVPLWSCRDLPFLNYCLWSLQPWEH